MKKIFIIIIVLIAGITIFFTQFDMGTIILNNWLQKLKSKHSSASLKLKEPLNQQINFSELKKYAVMAKYAYKSDSEIINKYGIDNVVLIQGIPNYNVNYYLLTGENKQLYLAIRGTSNIHNAIVDMKFDMENDEKLNIQLHDGFRRSARNIFHKLVNQKFKNSEKTILQYYHQKGYQLNITGHSLGGAIANILLIYLQKNQYKVNKVITFGQPKITDEKGVNKYSQISLLRVQNGSDIVPLVPLNVALYNYKHFGDYLILLKKEYFTYLNYELAAKIDDTSSWVDLGIDILGNKGFNNSLKKGLVHHGIDQYIQQIDYKIKSQKQVYFVDQQKYK